MPHKINTWKLIREGSRIFEECRTIYPSRIYHQSSPFLETRIPIIRVCKPECPLPGMIPSSLFYARWRSANFSEDGFLGRAEAAHEDKTLQILEDMATTNTFLAINMTCPIGGN